MIAIKIKPFHRREEVYPPRNIPYDTARCFNRADPMGHRSYFVVPRQLMIREALDQPKSE